jgi:hypothetical protein
MGELCTAFGGCMKKYRLVNAAVHAGLAMVCFQFLKWFLSHPDAATKLYEAVPQLKSVEDFIPLAAAAVLTGVFKYSDRFARWIIEDIPLVSKLLRRLLAGSSFAEGDWPLVVVDGKSGELVYLGFATVGYRGEQLTFEGTDWFPDGRFAHDFTAKQTLATGNVLQYWYEQGHNAAMKGYTEVYFFPKGARRERLSGRFIDDVHPNVRFYARRQRVGWFGRRLRSLADQLAAARDLWTQIAPDIPRFIATPLSTPWEVTVVTKATVAA